MTIAEQIVQTAKAFIGKEETPNNSGFKDPAFQKKMQAVGFQKGHSWCSYFAELVWAEAYGKQVGFPEKVIAVHSLFSGSAVQTYNNFRDAHYPTSTRPTPGALAVWRYGNGWQGHIGIVIEVRADGTFVTIEGNTNDNGSREGVKVARKVRKLNEPFKAKGLNIIGFILPI